MVHSMSEFVQWRWTGFVSVHKTRRMLQSTDRKTSWFYLQHARNKQSICRWLHFVAFFICLAMRCDMGVVCRTQTRLFQSLWWLFHEKTTGVTRKRKQKKISVGYEESLSRFFYIDLQVQAHLFGDDRTDVGPGSVRRESVRVGRQERFVRLRFFPQQQPLRCRQSLCCVSRVSRTNDIRHSTHAILRQNQMRFLLHVYCISIECNFGTWTHFGGTTTFTNPWNCSAFKFVVKCIFYMFLVDYTQFFILIKNIMKNSAFAIYFALKIYAVWFYAGTSRKPASFRERRCLLSRKRFAGKFALDFTLILQPNWDKNKSFWIW